MIGEQDGLGTLQPGIERRGLRDEVYDRLLELLLSGEVPPGARLSIDTMARRLDVSPTPVREAMVLLERTGLVTREALKGYRVAAPLSSSQLAELFEARMMLETTATQLATPADAEMIRQLRDAELRHRAAGDRVVAALAAGHADLPLTTEYFASDVAFHQVIFRHCRNRYVIEMSETLGAQLHRMRQAVLRGVTDVRDAIAEHEAIIDAFMSGAPDAPLQAMRTHIENVRGRSLEAERSR